jgi:DNA-binding CsgD family transcriptional regulator
MQRKEVYRELTNNASIKELKEVRSYCDQLILSNNYKNLNAGEMEVLYYFKQGLLKEQVAYKCYCTVNAIDKRLLKMYKKFNVHTIYQLMQC